MIRLVAAAPFFALAVFFAIRSWNPLGNGYFSSYPDNPDGLYLTIAGVGASVAALFAAAGLVIASRSFRWHGGFLVIAALAVLASALPYLLFKWTTCQRRGHGFTSSIRPPGGFASTARTHGRMESRFKSLSHLWPSHRWELRSRSGG
jgi:hypothetical protein